MKQGWLSRKPALSFSQKHGVVFLLVFSIYNFGNISSGYALEIDNLSNFKKISLGCYRFTDILNDSTSDFKTPSNLPPAYMGKNVTETSCSELHHLEIGRKFSSKIKGNLKVDTLNLRIECLKENIKNSTQNHVTHSTQIFLKVWRSKNLNYTLCGVIAKKSQHPNKKQYYFFESFFSPVLKKVEAP